MNKKITNKQANPGITVITTHVNADYDGISSMLAAHKLYPGSVVVFPGYPERNMKNFFLNSLIYLFNMADLKKIDRSAISRVVLVDTKNAERIGHLGDIIKSPGIDIHIYDHHPQSEHDIKSDYEVIETTGATTTILTKLLKKENIPLTRDEATIICMGIYEDTGSFTYSSTTEDDFLAAAYLISKGANVDIIASLITKEIDPRQLSCLNEMIQAAEYHNINGVEVVTTSISSEKYINDFSTLVQKMIRMENLGVIFALGRMGNKVYITARSRVPEVDVGAVLTQMGGGGHAYAASATIKEKTMAQTEQHLLKILKTMVRSLKSAKDLMSSPAIMVAPDVSCRNAAKYLTRYNINALLVVDKKGPGPELMGYITRQVIEKAMYHSLENIPVREFMTSEIEFATPETELNELQEKIVDNKQRILPIVDNGKVKGVVTRTDLLSLLTHRTYLHTGKFPDPMKEPMYAKSKNILKLMKERLPAHILVLLKKIGKVASELDLGVYVVGGFVRDLMLYRKNDDIDIVIEGDGIAFARKYAEMENARINTYSKFGTAVIILPDGFKVDVASARMEYYTSPAALPKVEMSSIKMDLYRRDFTINTLAIRLDPAGFGTLIDFFAAQRDLKDKAIRIIHNLSFVEDPTRIFRAIKFEQRFGFTIGRLTSDLIKNAIKMDFIKQLGGLRLFSEIRQILEEENPIPAILRIFDYDLMKVIHPGIQLSQELLNTLDDAKKAISWHDLLYTDAPCEKWAVYFLILINGCNKKTAHLISEKMMLPPKYEKLLAKERLKATGILFWLRKNPEVSNSALHNKLSQFRTELILFMMATSGSEQIRKTLSHYYTKLRNIKLSIRGRDLREMGIKPGPRYNVLLNAALDAKLDGKLKTREDELEFIKKVTLI